MNGSSALVEKTDPVVTLVVDDSAYARRRLRRFLLGLGYGAIVEAADGEEAAVQFRRYRPRLVLLDQVMRGRTGLEIAADFHAEAPEARIVMLTVVSDPQLHFRAQQAGVERVLGKNDWDALRQALEAGNA